MHAEAPGSVLDQRGWMVWGLSNVTRTFEPLPLCMTVARLPRSESEGCSLGLGILPLRHGRVSEQPDHGLGRGYAAMVLHSQKFPVVDPVCWEIQALDSSKSPCPKPIFLPFGFVDLVHQNPSLEFPAHLGKIVIPRSLGSACSLRLRPMFCEIRLLTCFRRTSLSPRRARAAPGRAGGRRAALARAPGAPARVWGIWA